MLTPPIHREMGSIRAESLRNDARDSRPRRRRRRGGGVRRAVGTGLVNAGLRLLREVT
jgi:hypothetical protein